MGHPRYRRVHPPRKLEVEAYAAGDEVGAPVVDVVGIIGIGFEAEVARLVGTFDEPAPEVVAEDAADGVSVVKIRIVERRRAVRRFVEAWRKFGRAFDAGEKAAGGSEFVLNEYGRFEQLHVISVENHSAIRDWPAGVAGRRDETMDLEMDAGSQMLAEVEGGASVDGLFGRVLSTVLGPAQLSAANDVDAVGKIGRFPDNDFAVDGADGARFAGLSAETISGCAEIGGDVSALLSAGRDGERDCREE